MDVFFKSYTSWTMDFGVYKRSSTPSIYVWRHLCFCKGYFAVKKSKRKFSNVGVDQTISWTEK